MNVLSLFDGMSCGQIALNRLGIKYKNYFASEIKKSAIKVTQHNYPNTIQLGDIRNVKGKDLPKIDLILAGSPCQDFSIANPKGREGLNGEKSSLFFEFYRLLKECNPKYYLLENVLMNQQSYINLSDIMKCYPVEICSSKVSAQIRKRLYWTNIKTKKDFFGFETVDIPQPDDKNIFFQDIITTGYADKLKSRCLNTKSYIPSEKSEYIWKRYNTTGMLSLIFDQPNRKGNFRTQNIIEMERLQTVPEGYTSVLTTQQACNVLGDGWTVDVICHIFSFGEWSENGL